VKLEFQTRVRQAVWLGWFGYVGEPRVSRFVWSLGCFDSVGVLNLGRYIWLKKREKKKPINNNVFYTQNK
jgi:hypothetical protein